jgi:hypothetical protein
MAKEHRKLAWEMTLFTLSVGEVQAVPTDPFSSGLMINIWITEHRAATSLVEETRYCVQVPNSSSSNIELLLQPTYCSA